MVEGQSDPMHFHDPTALAVAGLSAACSGSKPLLDSFFETGGIPAIVRVLADSRCPLTLGYTVDFIAALEAQIIAPGRPEFCQDFAENSLMNRAPPQSLPWYMELHDSFFHAGGSATLPLLRA
jgi:hypothetical protein